MNSYKIKRQSIFIFLPMYLMILFLFNSCMEEKPANNIRLPNFFSDNMVLQREQPIPIWGKADAGGKVVVKLADQNVSATVDKNGKWMAELNPEKAGGPFDMLVIGKDTTTISNIMIGEVWICSGQSNMGWPVKKSDGGEEAINTANFPNIRLFTTWLNAAIEPLDNLSGTWDVCSPKTVGDFSGAAFFFGRKLHKDLKVPIGLIETQVGGTPAEAWMTRKTLEKEELFRPILEYWDKLTSKYSDYHENFTAYHKRSQDEFYGQIIDAYWKEVRELQKKGLPRPPEPKRVPGDRQTPEVLFNAMLKPFVPMAIKGVFWYQGEANTGRGYQYQTLFPALINDWREAWQRPQLPFIFVQLPFIHKTQTKPVEKSHRAEVRHAQLLAHKNTPHTGMVITIDTGREDNDHPFQKTGSWYACCILGTNRCL